MVLKTNLVLEEKKYVDLFLINVKRSWFLSCEINILKNDAYYIITMREDIEGLIILYEGFAWRFFLYLPALT